MTMPFLTAGGKPLETPPRGVFKTRVSVKLAAE